MWLVVCNTENILDFYQGNALKQRMRLDRRRMSDKTMFGKIFISAQATTRSSGSTSKIRTSAISRALVRAVPMCGSESRSVVRFSSFLEDPRSAAVCYGRLQGATKMSMREAFLDSRNNDCIPVRTVSSMGT